MSGYAGYEPERTHEPSGEFRFGQKDGRRASALREKNISKQQELEFVNRLAYVRVYGNRGVIEAAANLCLYAGLDLNDPVLREGVLNKKNCYQVEAYERSMKLLDEARRRKERGDYTGYTAIAAVVGYFPPETSDFVITTLDPNYDNAHPFIETASCEEIRIYQRPGNGG